MAETRRALVSTPNAEVVKAYLPANYSVIAVTDEGVLIEGRDVAGWTLDDYVIPRLASGLYFAKETTTGGSAT